MTSQPTLSDEDFLAAFLDCRLQPADFNHRGHLRAAWLLLQREPLESAIEQTCRGIARLAAHLGAAEKYHRTLTEGLLRLMAAARAAELSWADFERSQPQLFSDARTELARHYSAELLARPEARERFLPPDLLPLPPCPIPNKVNG